MRDTTASSPGPITAAFGVHADGTAPATPLRMGVILTVFNRADLTVQSLHDLFAQDAVGSRVELDVVMVDDKSTDGTSQRVAEAFPQVRILHGDGQRWWSGGMRMAWAAALERDPDITMWLNDDTMLDGDAISVLLDTLSEVGQGKLADAPVIVAGATTDPASGQVNYSGVMQHPWRKLRFDPVVPHGSPQQSDTMNGNAVLVPREVVRRIGTISRAYTHSMGDYDYGMRARLAGCEVWVTPRTIGRTQSNPGFVPTGDVDRDMRELRGLKHLPPEIWRRFAMRWAGPLWPLYWASPYLRRSLWVLRRVAGRD